MKMEENKSQLVNDYAIENFKSGLNLGFPVIPNENARLLQKNA